MQPTHHDEGSVITLDILLTDRAEFEGGQLGTLEADVRVATEHKGGGRCAGRADAGAARRARCTCQTSSVAMHCSLSGGRGGVCSAALCLHGGFGLGFTYAARVRVTKVTGIHLCGACACHESEHKPTAGVGDRSHKYHCVTPVTRGVRQVMVTEYWRGPPRHCPHRCDDIVRARPHPRPGQTTAACVPSKHQSKHGLMGGATISDCET